MGPKRNNQPGHNSSSSKDMKSVEIDATISASGSSANPDNSDPKKVENLDRSATALGVLSNSEQKPGDASPLSKGRPPAGGGRGSDEKVAERELDRAGGGSTLGCAGGVTNPDGSSTSKRRRRTSRQGEGGGGAGAGSADRPKEHPWVDVTEEEGRKVGGSSANKNAEKGGGENAAEAMEIDDTPPSDSGVRRREVAATITSMEANTDAVGDKMKPTKRQSTSSSNNSGKRLARKPHENVFDSYSDNSEGDAFIRRRPPSARNLARAARASGGFGSGLMPPTTPDAPLVIDSDEDEDDDDVTEVVISQQQPSLDDLPVIGCTVVVGQEEAAAAAAAEAVAVAAVAMSMDTDAVHRDSSFVSTQFGDGVVGVRSRSERRGAMAGMYKVYLDWGTAFLRNECIRPVPHETRLVYPNKETTGAVKVTRSDVIRLQENMFLNDTIIDFYLRYLISRDDSFGPGLTRSSVHVFSALVVQAITNAHVGNDHSPDAYWRKIQKWTKGVDVFSKDLVLFPINSTLHWSLLVLVNPNRFHERLRYQASIRRHEHQQRQQKEKEGRQEPHNPATGSETSPPSRVKSLDEDEEMPLVNSVIEDRGNAEACVGQEVLSTCPRHPNKCHNQQQQKPEPGGTGGASPVCNGHSLGNHRLTDVVVADGELGETKSGESSEDGASGQASLPPSTGGAKGAGDTYVIPHKRFGSITRFSSCAITAEKTTLLPETKKGVAAASGSVNSNGINNNGVALCSLQTLPKNLGGRRGAGLGGAREDGGADRLRGGNMDNRGQGRLSKARESSDHVLTSVEPWRTTPGQRDEGGQATDPEFSDCRATALLVAGAATKEVASGRVRTKSRLEASSPLAPDAAAVDVCRRRRVASQKSSKGSSNGTTDGDGFPRSDGGVHVEKEGGPGDWEGPVPCMLLLDSTKGHRSQDVYKMVRKYVEVSWNNTHGRTQGQKINLRPKSLPGCSPPVPLQTNDCDCGVYVIHYSKLLLQSPPVITEGFLSKGCRGGMFNKKWFDHSAISRTRKTIRDTVEALRWDANEQQRANAAGFQKVPGK